MPTNIRDHINELDVKYAVRTYCQEMFNTYPNKFEYCSDPCIKRVEWSQLISGHEVRHTNISEFIFTSFCRVFQSVVDCPERVRISHLVGNHYTRSDNFLFQILLPLPLTIHIDYDILSQVHVIRYTISLP